MSNTGTLSKLDSQLNSENIVEYQLPLGDKLIPLNHLIGHNLTLTYTGNIYCSHCAKKTKKSYSQGYCFVCMKKLARCDMCMMKPEICHFEQGTCREPEWAESVCMTSHYVYLSNTSAIKVGITRQNQLPTRWIDQGATQGLPIFEVRSRHISGLVEVALAEYINDKTNWRNMLKGDNNELDLKAEAAKLIPLIDQKLNDIRMKFGCDAIKQLNAQVTRIHYPLTQHPDKVKTHNFDKTPIISGILQGIKGQYLIFDTGVLNIRKFTSYEIALNI